MIKHLLYSFNSLKFIVYLFPIIIIILFFTKTNTPEFVLPVFLAGLASLVPFFFVDFKWGSFVSIFSLGHFVQYFLAAIILLKLSSPFLAIEEDLWHLLPDSMYALIIGMFGLGIGVYLTNNLRQFFFKLDIQNNLSNFNSPKSLNILLTLLVIPVAIIYVFKGIYFHKDAGVYDMQVAVQLGFLGYLVYISYVGVILQLRKYIKSKNIYDLILFVCLLLFQFLIFAPSGSRRNTLFILVISGFYYFHWEKDNYKKGILFIFGTSAFMILLPILELYRTIGVANAVSFMDRFSILIDFIFRFDFSVGHYESLEIFFAVLGRRLADFFSVGYLMERVPRSVAYFGFSDVTEWFKYLIPTLLRPDTTLSYTYDAFFMDLYGFRSISVTGGSSPMMIIGDLYHRGGWFCIFFGMMFIGCLLRLLDFILLKDRFINIVLWVLFLDTITNLHSYTVLKFFTSMTRHLFIYYLIAIVIKESELFAKWIHSKGGFK